MRYAIYNMRDAPTFAPCYVTCPLFSFDSLYRKHQQRGYISRVGFDYFCSITRSTQQQSPESLSSPEPPNHLNRPNHSNHSITQVFIITIITLFDPVSVFFSSYFPRAQKQYARVHMLKEQRQTLAQQLFGSTAPAENTEQTEHTELAAAAAQVQVQVKRKHKAKVCFLVRLFVLSLLYAQLHGGCGCGCGYVIPVLCNAACSLCGYARPVLGDA